MHRFPFSCVSVGLTIGKQPVVGVVYNPVLDELYHAGTRQLRGSCSRQGRLKGHRRAASGVCVGDLVVFTGSLPQGMSVNVFPHRPLHPLCAVRGGGAFLNGSPIRASDTAQLSKALVATELGTRRDAAFLDAAFDRIRRLGAATRSLRCTGSCALNLCSVAMGRCARRRRAASLPPPRAQRSHPAAVPLSAGAAQACLQPAAQRGFPPSSRSPRRLDAYYEVGLGGCWDLCAAVLVLQEAGGRVLDPQGAPRARPPSASRPRRHICLLTATAAVLAQQRVMLVVVAALAGRLTKVDLQL